MNILNLQPEHLEKYNKNIDFYQKLVIELGSQIENGIPNKKKFKFICTKLNEIKLISDDQFKCFSISF